jgi:hypothetical protein
MDSDLRQDEISSNVPLRGGELKRTSKRLGVVTISKAKTFGCAVSFYTLPSHDFSNTAADLG